MRIRTGKSFCTFIDAEQGTKWLIPRSLQVCFKRDGLEEVPGCTGVGRKGADYCIKPPASNTLVLAPPGTVFQECQGHCTKTKDCAFGLVCLDRGKNATVPGCSGWGHDYRDYCTTPQSDNDLVFKKLEGRPDSLSVLGECEGECTQHSDCGDGLKCFFRGSTEPVPGCTGRLDSKTGYCFRATEGESLIFNGWSEDSYKHHLGLCEGSCRADSDCEHGLVSMNRKKCCPADFSRTFWQQICFKRQALEPVPGCTNLGRKGADYCIKPPSEDTLAMGSPEEPLTLCRGHCSSDYECELGLSCFDRRKDNAVPGCTGIGRLKEVSPLVLSTTCTHPSLQDKLGETTVSNLHQPRRSF